MKHTPYRRKCYSFYKIEFEFFFLDLASEIIWPQVYHLSSYFIVAFLQSEKNHLSHCPENVMNVRFNKEEIESFVSI